MVRETFHLTLKTARKVVVAVIGTTIVLLGVVMIVLPGPALLVIPAGLAVLGIEFAFARRWLKEVKKGGESAWAWVRGTTAEAPPSADRR